MPADALGARREPVDLADLAGRLAREKGAVIGSSEVTVAQPEEDAFAALIGDWDPMHNDPAWHMSGGEGPIVLGFHVLARLEANVARCPVLATSGIGVTTIGIDAVRFPAPFPVGASTRIEVALHDVALHDDGILLTTTQRSLLEGAGRPTMVATHLSLLSPYPTAPSPGPAALVGAREVRVAEIPPGSPVVPAADNDTIFFQGLAARGGEWLGATAWTSISDREAHAFSLLCGDTGSSDAPSHAHPFAGRALPRLELLSLRAYFSPQVGLPVLTDRTMMAYNYGVDSARWFADVDPGTPLRDHVQLRDVETRRPGDHLVTTRHVLEAAGNPIAVLVADCKTLYRVTS